MSACADQLFDKAEDFSAMYSEEDSRNIALAHCNQQIAKLSAEQRVAWALDRLPGAHVLSSSFGAQAAVSLHLLTQQKPDIPVILIDTGYLFPETYQFIDKLTEELDLQLNVYRSELSPAWQEARYGQRWTQGQEGLVSYNNAAKVEPMQRALQELNSGTWFAGLRRTQSDSRKDARYLSWSGGRWKVHPIADWTDQDIYRYLKKHDLPYHPLWEQGYLSIGDHHTTRSIHEVSNAEDLRFFGLQRECGIHEIDLAKI